MSNKQPKYPIPGQQQKNPNHNNGASIITTTMGYTGPIPPASELERYNAITPGLAERIIAMAEKEQESRLSLNKSSSEMVYNVEKDKIRITRRGQWFALVAITLILGFSSYIGYLGNGAAACSVVGGVIIGVIIAFTNKEKKDIKL